MQSNMSNKVQVFEILVENLKSDQIWSIFEPEPQFYIFLDWN